MVSFGSIIETSFYPLVSYTATTLAYPGNYWIPTVEEFWVGNAILQQFPCGTTLDVHSLRREVAANDFAGLMANYSKKKKKLKMWY